MRLLRILRGSSAKWYVLGIASAVAAGWIMRAPDPLPPQLEDRHGEEEADQPPDPEAIELVLAARAFDRAHDSVRARQAYLEAGTALSPIEDYLRLRAAQLFPDSADRWPLYRRVRTSPAREQVELVEARVLEKRQDLAGAIRLRQSLGQPAEVFRLRLQAESPSGRRGVLRDLVQWVEDSAQAPPRSAVAGAAFSYRQDLSAASLLTLARAASPATSSTYYALAETRGARLATADHAAWGEALFNAGKYRDAAGRLRRVSGGPAEPKSLLLRSRAMLRAAMPGGKPLLAELLRRFPRDTTAVPTALFLLGDLARDTDDYTAARRYWKDLGVRFPTSGPAPRARFLAALILYTQGNRFAAAAEWDSLFTTGQGEEEALAAGYWAGRAYQESGDSARAADLWQRVLTRSRLSYYSRLAHRRLGRRDSTLQRGDDSFESTRELRAARTRVSLLAVTGLAPELAGEITWLAARAGDDPTDVLGTAAILRDHNRAALTAQLGWRALANGAADSRTYRLIFPLMFEEPLSAASKAAGVEPALSAALIRQESLFDSAATSRAGARGLMQLMPSVGKELARQARIGRWDADSLYQPRRNLQLGTTHLAWAINRYGGLERTLAAYNAGGSRVTRWSRFPGSNDPELFVEWIPFPETRTYVRTVLRNLEFYRGLYAWN